MKKNMRVSMFSSEMPPIYNSFIPNDSKPDQSIIVFFQFFLIEIHTEIIGLSRVKGAKNNYF